MEVVVLSYKHGLAPFYWRLRNEKIDSYLIFRKANYERAWAGKVEPVLRGSNGEITEETLGVIRDRVASGDATLMTDYRGHGFTEGRVLETIAGGNATGLLRLGAWYDGFMFQAPHLMVCDEGLWPGGLGPSELGGLTLIHLAPELHETANQILNQAKPPWGFVGLVQLGLDVNTQTGNLGLTGATYGWPWLQTHAFVSELENFGELVMGKGAPRPTPGKRFVCVVPVSIPPWPSPGRAPEVEVGGLTPQFAAKFMWHDVAVQGSQLRSAGLDGLLGVARGAASQIELARATALGLVGAVRVPQKQTRLDACGLTATVLAQLESSFGLVI